MQEVGEHNTQQHSPTVESYTEEFLDRFQSLLEYDGLEISSDDSTISHAYLLSKDAFNTHLNISARRKYDDILVYHVVDPGRYEETRRYAAENIANRVDWSVDQEGMAYTTVRPGVVRQDNQPGETVRQIYALDQALY